MKKFISILNSNKDLKRGILLTMLLVSAIGVYLFYSASDLPFVYSQF